MGRHDAVVHGCGVDGRAVVVLPRDRVGAQGRVVGRRVGRIALHRLQVWRPSRERVGVLCRRRLGRRRAVVGGRFELLDQPFRKNRGAVVVNPRHGVLGDEGAQARVQPIRELPHRLVPSLECHAALHLGGGPADVARAARGVESARIHIPAAAAEIVGVIPYAEPGDIAAADGDLADREAVGEGGLVCIAGEPARHAIRRADGTERVAVGNQVAAVFVIADEATRVPVFHRNVAGCVALRCQAAVADTHEAAGACALRRDVARRPTAAYRRIAVRLADKAARARTPCRFAGDSGGGGAVFDKTSVNFSRETTGRAVVATRYRAAFDMDVGYV